MEPIIDQGWFLPEQLISPPIGPSSDPYNSSSTLSCMDSSNTTQSNKNMKKKKRSNNNTSNLRQAMRAYSPLHKKKRTSNGAEDEFGQHQSLTLKMASNPDSDQESSSRGTITSACFQAKGTSTSSSALVIKERRMPLGAAKLVWVSTMKGVGRKIIHGVMYRSGENAKVVCHCHRRHLSMAQFVLHGGGSPTQIANPLMNIVVRMGFS